MLLCVAVMLIFSRISCSRSKLRLSVLLSSRRTLLHHIRCATTADIPHIDSCNRAYLPENYWNDYFEEQLKRWGELSLVAVSDRNELMGYALGRIEDLTPTPFLHIVSAETRPPDYTGHLASIAVHSRFRGFGVAQSLMRRMHFNMVEYYGVDKVNLLCRVSNKAAIALYRDQLGYVCDRTVPGYYHDGEDAYLMVLTDLQTQQAQLSPEQRQEAKRENTRRGGSLSWPAVEATSAARDSPQDASGCAQERALTELRQNAQAAPPPPPPCLLSEKPEPLLLKGRVLANITSDAPQIEVTNSSEQQR